ncbi:MAG: GDP-mannose 4,6-dehydratase [Actinomycetota bacterium]
MTSAFVTGITGQDGSYLAELLLAKGYEVHGLIRRSSTFNTGRIDHFYQDPHDPDRRLFLHHGDLTDGSTLARLLAEIRPDEIYNLGAQSHVAVSFEMPEYTADVTAIGSLRLFESVREAHVRPRIYQASSSEMYGNVPPPQSETSPFDPVSPYAAAKLFAHQMAGIYRTGHDFFIARGILFNHESPRRGPTFVTRKVTMAVARICAGRQQQLFLGNLDSRRDWGYAAEYVEAMWQMLQASEPDDYVLATGSAHSVRDLCQTAFALVGRDWQDHVATDDRYLRPIEVSNLIGDATKAREKIGWQPQTDFEGLVQIMLQSDLRAEGLSPADHLVRPLVAGKPPWAKAP